MTARILLVRDGDQPAATVERVLARDYAEIRVALGWAEAETALASETFDLAVVGGAGDGAAAGNFVRRLRAGPVGEHLPVIAAIQILKPEAAAEAYRAGADAVIGPHPDTVLLGARLRHLLRHQGLLEELRLRERTTASLGVALAVPDTATRPARRVLVLTDDGHVAPELRAALGSAGFEVSADVARPIGAVVPREAGPDLVLIDVSRADPLAVAARFRISDRRRVVAVTHEARDPFRAVRALELGLAEPLPRPLDPAVTAAALARMGDRQATVDRLKRHHADALDLAVTDSLTGVFNRRYLDAYFAQKGRAQPGGAFALLLIDIDRFKDINDRCGHAAGDTALHLIAQRLLANVRNSDMVVRVGGEEFVVMMPGADRATAEAVAERLRAVIAERPFTVAGEAIRVTVSIGIAEGALGPSPAAMLAEADTALYASKRNGRNRVTAAAPALQQELSLGVG
jgi:two-component system cell cycle response regulator